MRLHLSSLLVLLLGLTAAVLSAHAQYTTTTSTTGNMGNCDLNYILLGSGLTLSPMFNSKTYSYTVTLPTTSTLTSATIQAWQTDSMAVLQTRTNGGAYSNYIGGGNPVTITLSATGTTTLEILITCDGCTATYTIQFVGSTPTQPPLTTYICDNDQTCVAGACTPVKTCTYACTQGNTCRNGQCVPNGSLMTCQGPYPSSSSSTAPAVVHVCDLTYLMLGGGMSLSPFFSASTHSYTVNAAAGSTSATVQAWQTDSSATLSTSTNGAFYNNYIGGGNPITVPLTAGTTTTLTIKITTASCTTTYTISFVVPSGPGVPPPTGGYVVGDPQFTGLRGQSYQVHGVAGEVYNLISSPSLQVNSKFVFLSSGKCPVINGVRAKGCFSHPGSYLGEIGIKTVNGDRIKLVAGSADNGFASVTVNGRTLKVDDVVTLASGGMVARNNSHVVSVTVDHFAFIFENSDMYINQRVRVVDWSALATSGAHGLLGQTYTGKTYPNNQLKDVQGDIEDYIIAGRDLFGDQFVYNQFPTTKA